MFLPSWVREESKRYNPGNQIQLGNLSGAWHSNCVARVEILSGKSCRNQLSSREDQNQFGQAGPSLSGQRWTKLEQLDGLSDVHFIFQSGWTNRHHRSFEDPSLTRWAPSDQVHLTGMCRSVVSMPSHVPCLHPILGLHPLAHQIPILSFISVLMKYTCLKVVSLQEFFSWLLSVHHLVYYSHVHCLAHSSSYQGGYAVTMVQRQKMRNLCKYIGANFWGGCHF